QTIAPGADYGCSFTGSFLGSAGDRHTNTTTPSSIDDDNSHASATGKATGSITDVTPAGITVTKTADPTSLAEPGVDFAFSVNVHNDSTVDTVMFDTLSDDRYVHSFPTRRSSDLQTIAPGADYGCSFTGSFLGSAGD